jgi:hypothetical protein
MNDIELQLHDLNSYLNKVKIEESARRHNLLRSINEIISIIEKINSAHVDASDYKQIKGFFAITGVMSPFISAIILPIIINYLTQYLPKL